MLPSPIILAVIGIGRAPSDDDPEKCRKQAETVWEVLHTDDTVSLNVRRGRVIDMLDDANTKGIDGGITIENPSFKNGQICGTVHAWYDIEVLGQHVKDDKKIPFCVPLQGCTTIYDFGIGTIEACMGAAPPQGINLCLKLCIGKYGLSKCWDVCTYVGLPDAGMAKTGSQCECTS